MSTRHPTRKRRDRSKMYIATRQIVIIFSRRYSRRPTIRFCDLTRCSARRNRQHAVFQRDFSLSGSADMSSCPLKPKGRTIERSHAGSGKLLAALRHLRSAGAVEASARHGLSGSAEGKKTKQKTEHSDEEPCLPFRLGREEGLSLAEQLGRRYLRAALNSATIAPGSSAAATAYSLNSSDHRQLLSRRPSPSAHWPAQDLNRRIVTSHRHNTTRNSYSRGRARPVLSGASSTKSRNSPVAVSLAKPYVGLQQTAKISSS